LTVPVIWTGTAVSKHIALFKMPLIRTVPLIVLPDWAICPPTKKNVPLGFVVVPSKAQFPEVMVNCGVTGADDVLEPPHPARENIKIIVAKE